MHTIGSALMWGTKALKDSGIETASLDADLLLSKVTGFSKEELFFHPETAIEEDKYFAFERLVARRKDREPIAYILGNKEFFGINFDVNSNVLIPRPDTEEIVEKALDYVRNSKKKRVNIVDLGTGSGAIAIAIAKTWQDWSKKHNFDKEKVNIYASDFSQEIIDVAKANAKKAKVDKLITFIKSDLLENIDNIDKINLLLANLPYLSLEEKDQHDEEIKHEPTTALYAGIDGLDVYKKLFNELKESKADPDKIIIECSANQVPELKKCGYSIEFVEV